MKDDLYFVLKIFLSWRILLFVVAFFSIFFIPVFGGSFPYYEEKLTRTGLPYWIWGFGNFDGVHYMHIAQTGYSAQFTQAFFPFFPLLVALFSFGKYYFLSGFFLSNIFFLMSLWVLYRLYKIDNDNNTSKRALILLLCYPTAFYFGSLYTESLFLLLASLVFLLSRKKYFILAGIVAGIASFTRINGIFLFLVIAVEIVTLWRVKELRYLKLLRAFIGLIIAPVGLITYMVYLKIYFNDPLYFINAQPSFGAGRSSSIILLPQVIFRYIKMLLTVSPHTAPFYTALSELVFSIIPFGLIILAFRKIRLSYVLFVLGCLLLPTLTGTFSSMPRYSLMIFPLLPFVVMKLGGLFKFVVIFFIIVQILFLILFIRGYWIA